MRIGRSDGELAGGAPVPRTKDPRPADDAAPRGEPLAADGAATGGDEEGGSALEVFRNRPFLLLWLAQASTQIGGNMVIYGLTVIILQNTSSKTAVSLLILTFLVPAVLFSAVAGVYVDRLDRRWVLIVTNLLRALAFVVMFLVGGNLPAILLLNIAVSTITVFFAPAEASMIPALVPRSQLLAANGIFTLTLNAAFALGFALLGPIVVTIAGAPALLLLVAALYLVAAGFCFTLPPSPPDPEAGGIGARSAIHDAEQAVGSTVRQLQEGITFIRENRRVAWSLLYLAVTASLVGVLGVLGTAFATETLGLEPKDFVVVVLPLGIGVVMGILLLNSFGRYLPRRRVIEVAMVALGILLALLAIAGPISMLLRGAEQVVPGRVSGVVSSITSLLAIVVLHRVAGGHRLRGRGHPVADAAPGGPAGGRPRPRLRHPQHARVGRELPADHPGRSHLGPDRDDQRAPAGRDVRAHLGRRLDRQARAAPGRRECGTGRRRDLAAGGPGIGGDPRGAPRAAPPRDQRSDALRRVAPGTRGASRGRPEPGRRSRWPRSGPGRLARCPGSPSCSPAARSR